VPYAAAMLQQRRIVVLNCNIINTVNSVVHRKKNDEERRFASRELWHNKSTLFLVCMRSSVYNSNMKNIHSMRLQALKSVII